MANIYARAREALDKIDEVLVQRNTESQLLWDALLGLRGPDDENENDKETLTVPVRRAVLPRCASVVDKNIKDGWCCWINGAQFFSSRPPSERLLFLCLDTHFGTHAAKAFRAAKCIREAPESEPPRDGHETHDG